MGPKVSRKHYSEFCRAASLGCFSFLLPLKADILKAEMTPSDLHFFWIRVMNKCTLGEERGVQCEGTKAI